MNGPWDKMMEIVRNSEKSGAVMNPSTWRQVQFSLKKMWMWMMDVPPVPQIRREQKGMLHFRVGIVGTMREN
jgi:hypothetical protein